jgi:hypothetical protein
MHLSKFSPNGFYQENNLEEFKSLFMYHPIWRWDVLEQVTFCCIGVETGTRKVQVAMAVKL